MPILNSQSFHDSIKTILESLPQTVVPLAIRYVGFGKALRLLFKMAGGIQAAKHLRRDLDKMLHARLAEDRSDILNQLISRKDSLVSECAF